MKLELGKLSLDEMIREYLLVEVTLEITPEYMQIVNLGQGTFHTEVKKDKMLQT